MLVLYSTKKNIGEHRYCTDSIEITAIPPHYEKTKIPGASPQGFFGGNSKRCSRVKFRRLGILPSLDGTLNFFGCAVSVPFSFERELILLFLQKNKKKRIRNRRLPVGKRSWKCFCYQEKRPWTPSPPHWSTA